jgi:hypothetical protein
LHTDGGDYSYMVHWCRTSWPGEPPKFYPISNGKAVEEAIDLAIERHRREHGYLQHKAAQPEHESGVRRLTVRGWVS